MWCTHTMSDDHTLEMNEDWQSCIIGEPQNLMLSEISQTNWGTKAVWFYLHRVPRIGKFMDTKGIVWITRGWRRGEWGVIFSCTQNFCLRYLRNLAMAGVITRQYWMHFLWVNLCSEEEFVGACRDDSVWFRVLAIAREDRGSVPSTNVRQLTHASS